MHRHNFDGLEIDWEFPGARGGQTDDKHDFTLFLQVRFSSVRERENRNRLLIFLFQKEFKEAATAESMVTGRSRILIAAAVAADPDIIVNGYEIEEISKYYLICSVQDLNEEIFLLFIRILDYINLMT